jgi:hypothetical protein
MSTEEFFYWVVLVFFRLLLWGNEKVSRSISLIINLKSAREFIPLRSTDEHGGFFLMGCTGVFEYFCGGMKRYISWFLKI